MRKKLLYAMLSLSIIIVVLIIINLVDIINLKREKENADLELALKILNVELNNSELSIIKGEKISIDYDKKRVDVDIDEKSINIKDNKPSKIEITVPNDFKFNQLYIESNKGNIKLNGVTSVFFSLESKSGNVDINKLNIINKSDISVNSSKMKVEDSIIHNVDLFIGDGTLTFDGILDGKNEINTSKGTLIFNLEDKIDDYRIEIEDNNKNIKVNNEIINNKSYTKGNKIIIINGKGKININGDDNYE